MPRWPPTPVSKCVLKIPKPKIPKFARPPVDDAPTPEVLTLDDSDGEGGPVPSLPSSDQMQVDFAATQYVQLLNDEGMEDSNTDSGGSSPVSSDSVGSEHDSTMAIKSTLKILRSLKEDVTFNCVVNSDSDSDSGEPVKKKRKAPCFAMKSDIVLFDLDTDERLEIPDETYLQMLGANNGKQDNSSQPLFSNNDEVGVSQVVNPLLASSTGHPKAAPIEATPMISKSAPMVDPEAGPMMNSETAPILDPEAAPMMNSETAPILDPEAAPMMNPKAAPMVDCEATRMMNPQAAPTVDFEATPMMNSEAAPPMIPLKSIKMEVDVIPLNSQYAVDIKLLDIKREKMENKEEIEIDMRTDARVGINCGKAGTSRETALAHVKNQPFNLSNYFEKNLTLLAEKNYCNESREGQFLKLGLMLRHIDRTQLPSVQGGRIMLIGPLGLTPVVQQYFEKFGMGNSVILEPPSKLKSILKKYQKDGNKSAWKYFIYMMDCDEEVDMRTLTKHLRQFRTFVKELSRVNVFLCRSIRKMDINYLSHEVLDKLSLEFKIETQTLLYDVEKSVQSQCEYVKNKYISLASGMYRVFE